MKTLSDHPLFIGAILERADARLARRKVRTARLQKVVEFTLVLVLAAVFGVLGGAMLAFGIYLFSR